MAALPLCPGWLPDDSKIGALKVLDDVAATRTPVTITKRGQPIATLVPYSSRPRPPRSLAGSILKEQGDPFGTDESWDADTP
jgi:prevent-host-death family protein